mmetsp:Transcript_90019/g.226464  ORF Transcript_90019/g.226464 Transcript_90019/m.226464 type:complete len:245 (-) Transcript_90019:95-829(-)
MGGVRMPGTTVGEDQQGIACVFFDLDDCLYKNNWRTAGHLTKKINEYCVDVLGLPCGKAYELFKQHGTALRGLIKEKLMDEADVDVFLSKVHDIPLDDIEPDPILTELLSAVPYPRWVFTASTREHALRCLDRLGIHDKFDGIISASSRDMIDRVGDYVTKHDRRCFEVAMEVAGVPADRAKDCIFLDDSTRNLKTAKEMGWRTVLVGLYGRDNGERIECAEADIAVDSIHEVREAMPELFQRT